MGETVYYSLEYAYLQSMSDRFFYSVVVCIISVLTDFFLSSKCTSTVYNGSYIVLYYLLKALVVQQYYIEKNRKVLKTEEKF